MYVACTCVCTCMHYTHLLIVIVWHNTHVDSLEARLCHDFIISRELSHLINGLEHLVILIYSENKLEIMWDNFKVSILCLQSYFEELESVRTSAGGAVTIDYAATNPVDVHQFRWVVTQLGLTR